MDHITAARIAAFAARVALAGLSLKLAAARAALDRLAASMPRGTR